jgi:hypothetical protein
MLSPASLIISHLYFRGFRGIFGVGVETNRACGNRQLILSMCGGKFAFLHKWATKPCFTVTTTHVLIIRYCAINMLLVLFTFFSSAVKNKPCDGDLKHAFILGPFSKVANTHIPKNE